MNSTMPDSRAEPDRPDASLLDAFRQNEDLDRSGIVPNDPGAQLSAASVARILASLIAAEHVRLRGSASLPVPLHGGLAIDEDGLGFDSLARLELVAVVNRFFNLQQTGIEDYLLVQRTFGEWVDLIGQHLRLVGVGARFGFSTSGSTGKPKLLQHGLLALDAEVEALAQVLRRVPGRGRVLAMVPAHHIYGFLFTVLLPDRLGLSTLDFARRAPSSCLRAARAGDLLIGSPFTWGLAFSGDGELPPGVTGITSTAPAPAGLWTDAAAAGMARMIEVYGSSETGGIGMRDGAGRPFTLLPHLQATPDGVHRQGLALDVQDRLDWISESQFTVAGRKDHMVQVGGVNVSPPHVRAVLMGDLALRDMAVRPGQSRLRAFCVPQDPNADLAQLEHRLRARADQVLSPPERPQSYVFGPELPRDAMGKLTDWPMPLAEYATNL